jgi:hypothetical protein
LPRSAFHNNVRGVTGFETSSKEKGKRAADVTDGATLCTPGNLEQVISLRYGDLANVCKSMQSPDYHS